tara:strand:+ start:145 stop:975 length:831 start_codon:yes stop_codon:yes gene_type:complete
MSSSESDIDEELLIEQERVIQIVKDIWNVRDVNDEGREYALIQGIRQHCDSSQNNKDKLKDLVEHLMCLAILKKRECIYKYKAYKKVCFVLATVFEDVGLPDDIIRLFYFDNTDDWSETRMNELYNWPNENGGRIPRNWKKCQLSKLPGVGKKSVMNIFHFYRHGTLPEINNNNFGPPLYSPTSPYYVPSNRRNNRRRDSQKDILIRQLQSSVEILSLENRSLKGSEEISDCTICLESEGTMIPTVCGHNFHTNCLMEWLKDHDSCPVCRNSLVTN